MKDSDVGDIWNKWKTIIATACINGPNKQIPETVRGLIHKLVEERASHRWPKVHEITDKRTTLELTLADFGIDPATWRDE